jgi:hypothetical protein
MAFESSGTVDKRASLHAPDPGLVFCSGVSDDRVFSCLHLAQVHANRFSADQAILAAVGRGVSRPGAGYHRLGRRASCIDASAPEAFLLDERDAPAGGGQPAGKRRPCLAGSHNHCIEYAFHLEHDHGENRQQDSGDIFDQGCRQILAKGFGQTAAGRRTSVGAHYGADGAQD